MSDELNGIFDALTPEHFQRATSSVQSAFTAPTDFDEFVERHLEMVQTAFLAADGRMYPLAWLTRMNEEDGLEHLFVPDDDELTGQWLRRLAREAQTHRSDTVFYSQLSFGEVVYRTNADEIDGTDLIAEVGAGAQRMLMWFAQHGEQIRSGVLTLVGNRIGEAIESGGRQRSPLLEQILASVED